MHVTSGDVQAAAAVLTTGSAAGWFAYRKLIRPVLRFLSDWHGTADRPGVPGRPGVMARQQLADEQLTAFGARLEHVERQVSPNGGISIIDIAERLETKLDALTKEASQ